MKKIVAFVGFAALAGSAMASNDFRLDLFLAARALSGPGDRTDIQTGGVINGVVGQTYVVELRYRINDSIQDTNGSNGLSSASLLLSANTASTSRLGITAYQETPTDYGSSNAAVLNPDNTGPGSGTGLINPFRGGLLMDTDPANGGSNGVGVIVPLALSAPGQRSQLLVSPMTGSNNNNAATWGVYTFQFVYNGGTVDFLASAVADAGTGNRFGYFERNGTANNPIPQTSNQATDGQISFVPAPASLALLGLGGLVAGRRRRA